MNFEENNLFQPSNGICMSQSLMKKLQEMKALKQKQKEELLNKQNQLLKTNRFLNPSVFLDRYEHSKKLHLSKIEEQQSSSNDSGLEVINEQMSDGSSNCTVVNELYLADEIEVASSSSEEIENSFEKSSSVDLNLDNVPVKGIAVEKPFEQLIEEQLFKEEADKKLQKNLLKPKRPFLRKGQGTARFNGPPPKPIKPKKVQKQTEGFPKQLSLPSQSVLASKVNDLDIADSNTLPALKKTQKPVRKTAMLKRRMPIKDLKLIPTPVQHEVSKPLFINEKESVPEHENKFVNDFNDQEVWSDANDDTVLTLETTAFENLLKVPADPDQSSNETFEQMEKYCNRHFAEDDNNKTLTECTNNFNMEQALDDQNEPIQPKSESNNLMQKLFPALKPPGNENQPPNNNINNFPPQKTKQKIFQPHLYTDPDPPKTQESALLKSKVEELQAEITKFQRENKALEKTKNEHELQVKNLKNEVLEFQSLKEEELKNIDQYRKTEKAKLKKDRRLFEDYVTNTKCKLPTKEQKDQILDLEKEIEAVKAEAKVKEQRLVAVNQRLRSQVENLTAENEALKTKVESLDEKVSSMEKAEEKRKLKETNRMWKEINKIVDEASFNTTKRSDPEEVEIVECNLPVTRHVSSQKNSSTSNVSRSSTRSSSSVSRSSHENSTLVKSHDKISERTLEDGSTEVVYANNTRKVTSEGGTEITFANGDVKTMSVADGSETYFYFASKTKKTKLRDGVQIIEFGNNQVERHFLDGSKHIKFADGSSKLMRLDGYEETTLPDGTKMKVHNGEKVIEFANGQVETHTPDYKKRVYPDGTAKTVFSDGRQETRYASGRLRVKDPSGRVVIDKMTNG